MVVSIYALGMRLEFFGHPYLSTQIHVYESRQESEQLNCLHLPIPTDQRICAAVMLEVGLSVGLKLGDDALGEGFAEFDAPLVEGVDVPDHALGEDAHLVEGDEPAERGGSEFFGEEDIRGAVSFKDAVGCERGGGAFGLDLGEGFSKG